MAKRLQLRRGTTAEHGSFTGAIGEVTVDTTKDTVVVHDGSLAGGYPLFQGKSDIIMLTTTKVQQRGAFLQSSTHQSLVLGY